MPTTPDAAADPDGGDYAPARSRVFVATVARAFDPRLGAGVAARDDLPRGTVLGIDGGTVLHTLAGVAPALLPYVAVVAEGRYLVPAASDRIDALCLLNHSCEPNVARLGGLVYAAKRDIGAGEALTLDYAPVVSGHLGWRMRCHCGAASCRGEVRESDWQDAAIAERLWPEWLPFVQQRILAARRG